MIPNDECAKKHVCQQCLHHHHHHHHHGGGSICAAAAANNLGGGAAPDKSTTNHFKLRASICFDINQRIIGGHQWLRGATET